MLNIFLNLIAAVIYKFIQRRHAGRYLELKRLTILINAERLRMFYY